MTDKDLKKLDQEKDTKEIEELKKIKADDLKEHELNKSEALTTPEGASSFIDNEVNAKAASVNVNQPNVVTGEEAEKLDKEMKEGKKENSDHLADAHDKAFREIDKAQADAELAKKMAEKNNI